MKKSALVVYICLCIIGLLKAEEAQVSIKTIIDRSAAKIGERVNYKLKIKHPEGVSFSLPADLKELGDWSVVSSGAKKPKNKSHSELFLELAAFSTGTLTIPSFDINYTAPDLSTGTFKTLQSTVTIVSILAAVGDKGGLIDIASPLSIPIPPSVILLIILFLAAAGAAYYYFVLLRKKKELMNTPIVILEPADTVALRELSKLRESKLAEEGKIKEFYIILTDIMREYFVRVYGVEAKDRTTSEIFADLRVLEKNKSLLAEIKDLLDDADLVKFAKFRPEAPIALEDITKAEKIIAEKKQDSQISAVKLSGEASS